MASIGMGKYLPILIVEQSNTHAVRKAQVAVFMNDNQ